MTDQPPMIGEYQVHARLGRGGQGAVYSALDPKLKRIVALKLMHGGREEEHQLLQEAENGAKVIHPNVVTIFDVKTWNEQVFIAMEYLPRGSLRAWISEEARPESQVVARFIEAARGLSAIHAAGLVHRDFKPDNVLLKENGTAAVADFGLSRAASDGAESRSGTRHFMAPELRAHGAATAATDQYAFCVSLYWALTRSYPPEGRDAYFPPAVPAWLRRILTRGLQQHPTDRYPSMDALIADLENTPEVRRRALLRTLALVVGLGALFAAALVLALSKSPQERALEECASRVSVTRQSLWSAQRIDSVAKNFAALAGSEGTRTFERVRARVDPQVDAWSRAARSACEIKEPIARRNTESCLEQRRADLAALTSYLSSATDPAVVKDVVHTLARELKPVETCAQVSLMLDREESELERALRADLAPARVLRAAGRLAEAQQVANDVAQRAETAGNVPRVRAEAAMLAAQLMAEEGRSIAGRKLESAIDLAEAAGLDELRARGWISLIRFHVSRQEFPEAAEAEKHATAIVERLGRPPLLYAPLQNERGNFEFGRDRLPEANAIFVELKQQLLNSYGPTDPAVLHATNNVLLSGDDQYQVAGFTELLTLTARELGEQHPETLFTRRNLAAALLNNKEYGLAEAHLNDLIATRTAGGPHLQQGLAGDYGLRSRVEAKLGKFPEAIADQEENLRRLRARASDNQLKLELDFLYGLKKDVERTPKAELEDIIQELCNLGFAPPDGMECPRK